MVGITRQHPRIAVNAEVMGGKPCIKGTRVPVDLILRYLGDGQSVEAILEAFPGLTREDVRAAEIHARAVPEALLDAVVAHFGVLCASAVNHRDEGGASRSGSWMLCCS